ncbi:MAG: hypothetical protein NTX61_08795 [Bacteroidetes bacterium]|nr:hypothetical protein [Bacteroidota bacterium]
MRNVFFQPADSPVALFAWCNIGPRITFGIFQACFPAPERQLLFAGRNDERLVIRSLQVDPAPDLRTRRG